MQYYPVSEARSMPGLRLVLSAGVPGPWGEAAKAVFGFRNVDYVPVEQAPMQPNRELLEWTGHRNAPIAVLDDEPPVTGWLDMIDLAERLGSGPSLLPADERRRVECLGFLTEIAGRDGLGWHRRILMCAPMLDAPADPDNPGLADVLCGYGVTEEALAQSNARIVAILRELAAQLERQKQAGSQWLVGNAPSALDLFWACFSMMLDPLSQDRNPMPDWLRGMYASLPDDIAAALDPALIAHRDRVYEEVIGLPLEY